MEHVWKAQPYSVAHKERLERERPAKKKKSKRRKAEEPEKSEE